MTVSVPGSVGDPTVVVSPSGVSPIAADAQARTGQHVAFLDGLRGLAVMIVFMSHASAKGMTLGLTFDGIGKSGVYLFFVLSSFLISSILLRGGRNLWTVNYLAKFFSRRFLRVYPLFALYVLCAVVTTPLALAMFGTTEYAAPFPLDLPGALQHLVLVRGDGVSWSIPVEMKYYFFSPFLVAALVATRARVGKVLAGTVALLAAVGAYHLAANLAGVDPPGSDTADLLAYLAAFIVGATLAVMISDRPQGDGTGTAAILQRAAGWLALAVLVMTVPSLFGQLTGQPVSIKHFHHYVVPFALLWALVLNACWAGDPWLRRFFTARPLRFLGLISFSFYLSHPIFQELSAMTVGRYSGVAAFFVALATTTLFSWLSFRIFEKPVLENGTNRVNEWLRNRHAGNPEGAARRTR